MNVPAKLDSRQLALEIDSELPGISANNIEYLQMNPCPEMLPENFIVGGTIKSPDLTRAAYLIDLPDVGAAS